MSCKYCNGEEYLINTRYGRFGSKSVASPGIRIDISQGELSVEAVADTYEPNYQEVYMKINCCPMCGERFSRL